MKNIKKEILNVKNVHKSFITNGVEQEILRNINLSINNLLLKFDEEQLINLSKRQGLLIDNKLIRLFFINNVGFRCYNEKDNIYGKFPICINIERFMNNLYMEYITSHI